jgi:hypothetical protein
MEIKMCYPFTSKFEIKLINENLISFSYNENYNTTTIFKMIGFVEPCKNELVDVIEYYNCFNNVETFNEIINNSESDNSSYTSIESYNEIECTNTFLISKQLDIEKYNKTIIKDYNYNYHIYWKLDNSYFTENELKEIICNFEINVDNTNVGDNCWEYYNMLLYKIIKESVTSEILGCKLYSIIWI